MKAKEGNDRDRPRMRLGSMELDRCRSVAQRVSVIVATGFGLGLAPVASGTAGTLPGVLLVLLMARWGVPLQIAGALILTLLAIPLCSVAERHFGRKDDGRIVADEFMTFPICMLGLPPEPWLLAVAFVVSRVFDIVKLPPARQWQSWRGGLGIVIDDAVAGIQTLIVMHVLYRILNASMAA